MHTRTSTPDQVAIVGMAVLLPGADSLDSYWGNLVNGVDAITEVPAHRWDAEFYQPTEAADRPDRVYCRNGGFVDQYADFEALRFGIMPNSIPDTEPDQLIALRVAAAAIDDAGGPQWLPSADRVGVVLGRGGYLTPGQVRLNQRVRVANQLVHVLRELVPEVAPEKLEQVRRRFSERLGPHQPEAAIGLVPNLAASRLANRLDLRGPAYTVDAACASSLLAVDQAVAELTTGRCDVMLAGGVHHCHDIVLWSVFSQLKALSRAGQSRPFDRAADGLLIGEGTGVVVLKRLVDAVRDDDRIYAVIRGTGVSSDGRTASLFNPEPAGQAVAIRRAWDMAGLDPAAADSLGLLEAHGTATPTGDLAELTTVAEVFGPPVPGPQPVIGSVKSMIGHAMPAAGVAGLVKAALAVHHGMLLPTLHCDDPRPELTRTRFAPLATARPWDLPGPRRAAVNAFGFGGINAHVLLEQAPGADSRPARSHVRPVLTVSQPDEVLWLAAADTTAMTDLLAADDAALRTANLAGPTRAPVDAGGCRLGLTDPTDARLAVARRIAARRKPWHGGRDIWLSTDPLLPAGGVAFVFPGLESRFAPRLDDVAAHFGWSGPAWSGADVGRRSAAGFEVSRMLCSVLDRLGVTPHAMAGHSVGEWTAMAAAGMFTPAAVDQLLDTFDPDTLQVPGVVFAAVGAAAARVRSLLADSAVEFAEVVLSHDNAPEQSVVCGPEEQVLRLVQRLRSRSILSDVLPFRSGFHTPAFEPFLGPVRAAHLLFDLHPPRVPVWSATTAAPFPDDPARVRDLFLRHLVEPVLFRSMVEAMYDAGIRVFLQVGVGQLASVVQEVLRGRDHLAVPVNVAHRSGLDQLRRVATALWVEGGTVDLSVLTPRGAHAGTRPRAGSGTVRLDLGGALVQLGGAAAGLLGRAPAVSGAADPADASLLDQLHDLTRRSPVTADLAALLRDTAQTAVAVVDAVGPGDLPRAAAPAPQVHRSVLQISTDAMPFLLDHCFFPQHEDWPHTEDRWPVVPATTITRLMLRAVERATPGIMVLGVRNARFDRWVIATPPVEVELNVKPSGPGEFAVGFGRYARASVQVGTVYPPAPAPLRPDRGSEKPPQITAEQLYTERWLFHGPQFQGITRLLALGEWHVRAQLTAPTAPGSLLDNVGQLVGYWIQSTQTHRTMVFPVGAESIDFFGPRPAAGEPVECVLRILELTEAEVRADAQLIVGDRVWAQFTGWVERRFDSHPHHRQAERFPQRYAFSYAQPEGWAAVFDRWPDAASRELLSRTMLGTADRAEYERQLPRDRRHWLLGRIAAKDAVRMRLWADGTEEIFPAELRVVTGTPERPRVGGWAGRDIGDFDVSLAQCAEVGVAIARAGRPGAGAGVGIDVRLVADRIDGFPLAEDERRALSSVTGTPELSPVWATRCHAAKEAVARAAGAGPSTITAATDRELTVEVAGRSYQVRHRELDNPDDLPQRRYVVAWTWGPESIDSHPTTFGDGR